MTMASTVRWAMLAVMLGACLLAAEGAPGEGLVDLGTASSVSVASSQGVTQGRVRRSTAVEEGDDDGSDYNNDEPDYGDEGTEEDEEEESSPAPPPTFLSAPLNLSLRPGDNFTLPCRVDSASIGKMVQMWLNGSQIITVKDTIMGDKNRVSRLPDMSLHVKDVRPEDSGAYTCQINSNPVANLTHHVKIPAPAKIISHSQKQTVVVGQSITLNCAVWGSPKPTVKWSLQNREIPDAVLSKDGSTLTIKSVTKHHEGNYKCIADNGVGQPVDTIIPVTVQNKPQVSVVRSKVNSGEGETAELACTVLGQPKPQVKWYKDGNELEVGTSRYEGSAVNFTYFLQIKNLEKTDFGVYTCSAKNKYGSRQKNITLTGFPDVPTFLGSRIEDGKVILQWDVASSAPIKAHEMRYRKQGVEDWTSVSPSVKDDIDGNIYRVEVQLKDLEPGNYEVVFHSQNEFGWGDESEPEHFQASEKHVHEEVSPSTEKQPAAETSKRGPNGSAAVCSLSSLAATLLATHIFKTLLNHL